MFANENKSFPNETEKIENKKLTYLSSTYKCNFLGADNKQ